MKKIILVQSPFFYSAADSTPAEPCQVFSKFLLMSSPCPCCLLQCRCESDPIHLVQSYGCSSITYVYLTMPRSKRISAENTILRDMESVLFLARIRTFRLKSACPLFRLCSLRRYFQAFTLCISDSGVCTKPLNFTSCCQRWVWGLTLAQRTDHGKGWQDCCERWCCQRHHITKKCFSADKIGCEE